MSAIHFGKWSLSLFAAIALAGCGGATSVDTPSSDASVGINPLYRVVDTGQVTCYDANGSEISPPSRDEPFFGQDAQYAGVDFNFTDNGDGTVSDANTALMWQKTPSSQTYIWYSAAEYCGNLELAGYTDWRMPGVKELFSIENFSTGWPYSDQTNFDLASGRITKDEQYWSSNHYVGETVEGGSDAAFGVNFVTGHIKAYPASAGGPIGEKYVRCVRGEKYGYNRFTDNGDGTITDGATSLMWAQSDYNITMDWPSALDYAKNATIAGYSDWRLPNVKELQSIVDYSRAPGAAESNATGPAIDPLFSCSAMTNEAGVQDYGYYWTSTSARFNQDGPFYYAWYVAFGRAVNTQGEDFHGAGAVRFDTEVKAGPLGEGGERYYNYVRLVRDAN
ncbi:MAG TPA: DUF1566 domain-containing protein [Epsilonproteobacteria bacterium]|nr:DUF1566 domain-containing protein [Campylobacterota bacterium]